MGFFVNYGMVEYGFPYKPQDNYTRNLIDTEQDCVVLENEHLKATFFPQFGGKLHSLFDKKEKRNLLFSNSIVRPCHLGVRNAWMSGGVEWNCGYVGRNAFTCDLMHTAQTKLDDGTPVLRFHQYERIRGVVYQMDFFLPEKSKLLFVRTKIINPSFEVVPMYWWSNIATPDAPGNRVIVPASNTYTARDSHPVKIAVPEYNGIDITYPAENLHIPRQHPIALFFIIIKRYNPYYFPIQRHRPSKSGVYVKIIYMRSRLCTIRASVICYVSKNPFGGLLVAD